MIKESEETLRRLEKVFTKLSDCLDEEFDIIGMRGLGSVLDNLDKTFALMERIATKLKKAFMGINNAN